MTKDEALRLASVVLDHCYGHHAVNDDMIEQTAKVIQAELEAKDEPVATKNNDGVTLHLGWDDLPVGTKLYTTPPQRTWIGLTDEEISDCMEMSIQKTCRAIEAKLRSKNHEI
jgi:hypothetical protein